MGGLKVDTDPIVQPDKPLLPTSRLGGACSGSPAFSETTLITLLLLVRSKLGGSVRPDGLVSRAKRHNRRSGQIESAPIASPMRTQGEKARALANVSIACVILYAIFCFGAESITPNADWGRAVSEILGPKFRPSESITPRWSTDQERERKRWKLGVGMESSKFDLHRYVW